MEPQRRRILVVVTTESDGPELGAMPDLSGEEVRVVAPLAQLSRELDVDDDVLLSIEDELLSFDPDEIWLVISPESEASWLESGVYGSALDRFGRPVLRVTTHRYRVPS